MFEVGPKAWRHLKNAQIIILKFCPNFEYYNKVLLIRFWRHFRVGCKKFPRFVMYLIVLNCAVLERLLKLTVASVTSFGQSREIQNFN